MYEVIDFIGLNTIIAIYTTDTTNSNLHSGYFYDWNVTIEGSWSGVPIGSGTHEYSSVPWCMKSTLDEVIGLVKVLLSANIWSGAVNNQA